MDIYVLTMSVACCQNDTSRINQLKMKITTEKRIRNENKDKDNDIIIFIYKILCLNDIF